MKDSDTAYIREQLAAWNPMRDDVDASWEYLHRSIVEALLYYCNVLPLQYIPKQPWISNETLGLIEMRAEVRLEGNVEK